MRYEEWRTIPSHPGYEVSSRGRFRNANTNRILSVHRNATSPFIKINNLSIRAKKLVAEAFGITPKAGQKIYPKDGDRWNIEPSNLICLTQSEWTKTHSNRGLKIGPRKPPLNKEYVLALHRKGLTASGIARIVKRTVGGITRLLAREV